MTVKPRTNYMLDMLILSLFIVVLVSGLLMWLVYSHGSTHSSQSNGRGGRTVAVDSDSTTTILGLSRGDMETIHNWAGVGIGGLVLVHILFHWKWIVCQTKQTFNPQPKRSHSKP